MLSVLDRPNTPAVLSQQEWNAPMGSHPHRGFCERTLTGCMHRTDAPQNPRYRVQLAAQPGVPIPSWMRPVARQMADLLSLEADWDADDAEPIQPRVVEAAIKILAFMMRDDTPAPMLVPLSSGGLQLEWHEQGIDIEIEIEMPDQYTAFYRDHQRDEDWDGTIGADGGPLRQALARLTERRHAAGVR